MLGAAVLPVAAWTQSGATQLSGVDRTGGDRVIAQDEAIFREKMEYALSEKYQDLSIGDRVVAMGKLLLGIPYVGGTLEIDSVNERLVTNLRGLDCVTLYENAIAMARSIQTNPTPNYDHYRAELTRMRYRFGTIDGYASRLHYSSDYFFDNVQRGLMTNVTQDVSGPYARADKRRIDFMSTHRAAYKQLKTNDAELAKIKAIEDEMSSRGGFIYVPKESVGLIENNIQNGDIIGITTSIKGLDMSHTGIAVRGGDGVTRFMHASSALNKVVISEGSLSEYLASNGKQTGIVVMRPLEVSEK